MRLEIFFVTLHPQLLTKIPQYETQYGSQGDR